MTSGGTQTRTQSGDLGRESYGYGFRLPMILVSLYARENDIYSGLNLGVDSLLAHEEHTFGLGCLTPRDCNANLPTGSFNFSAPSRAPMLFSTNWENWSCPMTLESARAYRALPPSTPFPYALNTTSDPDTNQD
jgi:hypothetical protein